MGYMLCGFDGDMATISNGSQLTFNTTSTMNGTKHELLSANYNECLTAKLQLCKNICMFPIEDMPISQEESRTLVRWLNRKQFHKLRIIFDDYFDLWFEASFNLSKIERNGIVYGLELNMYTNRPFALLAPQRIQSVR